MQTNPRVLCISYRCPPQTYPLAIRVKYFMQHLKKEWNVDVITAAEDADLGPEIGLHHVPERVPERLLDALNNIHLQKLTDLFMWPDRFLFWILPAFWKARTLLQARKYDAIVVFMMPYSQGLIGVLLKRLTGLPLIMNMNDSITCSDMNSRYSSVVHYYFAHALENLYVRSADAVIYVSKRNMERVRDRQPKTHQSKFHLIRRGSSSIPSSSSPSAPDDVFRILYAGGTNGWYQHWEDLHPPSFLKRVKRWVTALGEYESVDLDVRTHGPVYLGRAIHRVIENHPEWADRIRIDVYGSRYPDGIDQRVIEALDLDDVVHLHEAVSHDEALSLLPQSDLLFMSLPDRPDGSPGGRISAKSYEYLMTDRPILAALPHGENTDYLRGKPGVHRVSPSDVDGMTRVVETLAHRKLTERRDLSVDRSALTKDLLGETRAMKFEQVLRECIGFPVNQPVNGQTDRLYPTRA